MLTLVKFKARFPEFQNLPDVTLLDAIERGSEQSDPAVFGAIVDEAVGYLAAHFLALSPFGTPSARLNPTSEVTTYMVHYKRIATMRAAGWARVT
jgi:hypothetical protein